MSKLVRNIGNRRHRADRFFGTGAVWYDRGDICEIADDAVAEKMVRCAPDTFEIVEQVADAPTYQPPKVAETSGNYLTGTWIREKSGRDVRLIDASLAALRDFAREEHGLQIGDGHTRADVLSYIASNEAHLEELQDKAPPGLAALDPKADGQAGPETADEPEPEPEPEPKDPPW